MFNSNFPGVEALSPAMVKLPFALAVFCTPSVGVIVQDDAEVLDVLGTAPATAEVAFVPPLAMARADESPPAVPVIFPVVPDGRANTPVELTPRDALPLEDP